MRGIFELSTFVAIASLATSAHAQEAPKLTLAWSSPPQCTSEADVRMRVDRILGARSAPHDDVDARVTVTQGAQMFRAEIQLNSAGQVSTRHVEDASCNALADAVALIVALTVNPEVVIAAPPPEPAKTIAPKSPPPPPPATPVEKKSAPPVAADDTESRHPIFFGANLLIDAATLKSVGVGAEIVAGFNPHHASFELAGTWVSTQDAHYDADPTQGASEYSLGAGARGCWEIFDSAIDVGPCGGAELAGIFAQGFGATQKSDTSVALFRALLGAQAKWRFSRFAARLGAEAAIPFTRPSFVIDNAGKVQDVGALTVRLTFGAEVHF